MKKKKNMDEFLKTDLDDNEQSEEHTYMYTSIEHNFNDNLVAEYRLSCMMKRDRRSNIVE